MIRKIRDLTLIHKTALTSAILAASVANNKKITMANKNYDEVYDLAVIGGGSGGLATAF